MAATAVDSSASEIIETPNVLRAKVGSRFAAIDPVAVARAEAALEKLSGQFAGWMSEEVARLEAARERLRAERTSAAALSDLHLRAHDLKGLGGTYGFPLATRLCSSLCRLLDDPAARVTAPLNLIDAHVDAVRAVLRGDIRDPAHPAGVDLCHTLEARTAEYASSSA